MNVYHIFNKQYSREDTEKISIFYNGPTIKARWFRVSWLSKEEEKKKFSQINIFNLN